jgi:hypothetical protein
MKVNKNWLDEPEEHDFPAALDYLELVFAPEEAATKVELLKKVKTVPKKAKDLLRASLLPMLPSSNIHVKQNIKNVKKGKKLSPVLLVRGNDKLIIADGYHRVCAIYYLSEDLVIPCRIV